MVAPAAKSHISPVHLMSSASLARCTTLWCTAIDWTFLSAHQFVHIVRRPFGSWGKEAIFKETIGYKIEIYTKNTQLGNIMLVVSGCFVHPSAASVAGRSPLATDGSAAWQWVRTNAHRSTGLWQDHLLPPSASSWTARVLSRPPELVE